jgi:transcriptional regulator with XRE-family HTH domain
VPTIADVLRVYLEQMRRRLGTLELARLTGIPKGDLSKAARGADGRRVTLDQLQKIADGLGLPVHTVLSDIALLAAQMSPPISVHLHPEKGEVVEEES